MKPAIYLLLIIFTFNFNADDKRMKWVDFPLNIEIGTTNLSQIKNHGICNTHFNGKDTASACWTYKISNECLVEFSTNGVVKELTFINGCENLTNTKWDSFGLKLANDTIPGTSFEAFRAILADCQVEEARIFHFENSEIHYYYKVDDCHFCAKFTSEDDVVRFGCHKKAYKKFKKGLFLISVASSIQELREWPKGKKFYNE